MINVKAGKTDLHWRYNKSKVKEINEYKKNEYEDDKKSYS